MNAKKKEQKKEIKCREILDGALKAFCEKGVDATTIDHICKKVGCSHGLFYHYYDNKEELLEDLWKKWDFQFSAFMTELLKTDQSPTEKIRNLFSYIFTSIREEETFAYRLYFLVSEIFRKNESGKPFVGSEKMFAMMREEKETIRSFPHALHHLFQEGIDSGEFSKSIPVEEYIRYVLNTTTGTALAYVVAPKEIKKDFPTPNVDVVMKMLTVKD